MRLIECYFDGCCEPKNPGGNMGIGCIIQANGITIYSKSDFIPAHPNNTNNIAEYLAVKCVLEYLIEKDLFSEEVVIKGDSQLVVKQLNGEWAIKSGAYAPYAIECQKLIRNNFKNSYRIEWIPREKNSLADDLSKSQLSKNNVKVETHSEDGEPIYHFGKYRGKKVNDVEDVRYMDWVLQNVQLKNKMRTAIQEQKRKTEFLNK